MNTTSRSIIIGDPHVLTSEGLSRILTDAGHVVTQTTTIDSLVQCATEQDPDIILVNPELLGDRMSTIRELVKHCTGAVVLLSDSPDPGSMPSDAIQAGAKGYLSVDDPHGTFLDSLALLVQGSLVVSPHAGRIVLNDVAAAPANRPEGGLSERELQIAALVAGGAGNREIGDKLSISEHTVKVHLGNILTKLDLKNRQQLAAWAAREGLLDDISLSDQT